MNIKKFLLSVVLALANCPGLVQAQAAPQYSKPAVDSTFIKGVAERVMPEFPVGGIGGGGAQEPIQDPKTIAELLGRWNGIVINFSAFSSGQATGTIRLVGTGQALMIQQSILWNFYDQCALTAATNSCAGASFGGWSINSGGISFQIAGCTGGGYGNYQGQAAFTWTDFKDGGGPIEGLGGAGMGFEMQRAFFTGGCTIDGSG